MAIKADSALAVALATVTGSSAQEWTVERVTMPAAYVEFPGDPDAGIPAGPSAFEYFNILSGGMLLTVHGGGEATIAIEGPSEASHQQWWMLAPGEGEGKYKLVTTCKDSIPKRFVKLTDGAVEWVGSAAEATPVDIESKYAMSDAGKAVMAMASR